MGNAQTTGMIVKEYLKKYPSSNSRAIARWLVKDIPELFNNEETARSAIRYYRGASGKEHKRDLDLSNYMPKIIVPPSQEFDYSPLLLGDECFPILVGSDAHMPYHDQDAVEIFFDYGIKIKANTIIFDGDWLDMFMISKFTKDPREKDVAYEISMIKKLMKDVRRAYPKARLIYKFGNHEERWDSFMMNHAPEIFKVPGTCLADILNMDNPNDKEEVGFKKLKIEIVQDKKIIKAAHLYMIHGHEYLFSISNPVNPARGLYLRAKKSALCGHFHQTSEHVESAISGDITTDWSIGCLCYSEDTEILTQDGFKLFKNILPNDFIGVYDKNTDTTRLSKPLATQKYKYTGDMINFVGPRIDALVTPDHTMLYYDHNGTLTNRSALSLQKSNVKYNYKSSAPFISDKDYNLDYAKLCAWIVTEGTYDDFHKLTPYISIYQKKEPQVSNITELLNKLNLKFGVLLDKRNGVFRFKLTAESTRQVVSEIWGGKFEKRIPRKILNSSSIVLNEMIDILVAADGNKSKRNSRYIATIDDSLAEDYYEIIMKIGVTPRIRTVIANTNFKNNARINFVIERKTNNVLANNINVIPYNGFVYDFTSETGWLIIRRNKKVFIASNCGLKPKYMPLNKWNWGFASILMEDEHFRVDNRKIINGRIV